MKASATESQQQSGRFKQRSLFYALIVGLLAGVIAVLYQIAVKFAEDFALDLSDWGKKHWYGWIALPLLSGIVGLVVAKYTARVAPEACGGGIVNIKGTLLGVRKLRPLRLIPVKFLGSVATFAAGISLGPEAPAIQMGGAMGQVVGTWRKLSKRDCSTLIAAGAGAGFSAVFNAPLAGFIFVIEALRKGMSALSYGTALIACVAADFVVRAVLGQEAVFHFKGITGLPLHILPLALVIGLAAGSVGFLFKRLLITSLNLRQRFKIGKSTIGAIAGITAGVVLLTVPELADSGQLTMANILAGKFDAHLILGSTLLLCFGRMICSALGHTAEIPGGILVTTLTMGCYIGLFFARVAAAISPSYAPLMPGLVAIGMASALASSIRSPLTCTVLVVEITGEYGLLYALLVGTFAAYALGEFFQDKPIDDILLERDLKLSGEIPHGDSSHTHLELVVELGSPMDNALLADLDLPEGALITQVIRLNQSIIPSGSTYLKEGDELHILLDASHPSDALKLEELSRSGG